MKKLFLIISLMLVSIVGKSQFLIFLDKGDIFKSPETDMVVMDKYSFAKLHYSAEKYDTVKSEIIRYDSLLDTKDSSAKQIQKDNEKLLAVKDAEIKVLTDAYAGMMTTAQASIDRQNKLQVDYLKLQNKNRRAKRWRNFFMGTTAVFGAVIYLIVR